MSDGITFWSDAMQRTLLPTTIAVAVLWLIESRATWLTPKHRSWLWRLVFIKCLFVLCLPFALPLPGFLFNTLRVDPLPGVSEVFPIAPVDASGEKMVPIAVTTTLPQIDIATRFPLSRESTTATSADDVFESAASWLFLIWAIGLIGQWILLLHRHAALRSQLRRGRSGNIPNSLRTIYRETVARMDIRHAPALQINDRFTSPALVFNGRVLLVFPSDFQQRHGNEACRAAMAHELAHHRRSDLHWNALVTLLCGVLFFFPPLWLARRRYRIAMESACDWDAISHARVAPATYARLLIELLEPPVHTTCSPAIVSMAGSEPFRSLSERLKTMNRFNGATRRSRVMHAAIMLLMLCVLVPWTHADEKYNEQITDTQSSSATVTSSSSSQSSGNGETRSTSTVTGTASGNAAGSGAAHGKATSLRMRNGKNAKSNEASSSAAANVAGQNKPANRYSNRDSQITTSDHASSTSSIQINGIKISRSVHSEDGITETKMEVVDKTQEITLRETSDAGIEVRVRDREPNADGSVNEKVYTATTWEDFRQQAPKLAIKLKRHEGLVGKVNSFIDIRNGAATAEAVAGGFTPPVGVIQLDAKEMMKAQLQQMLDQHADNPQMQKMIRKTLDGLDKD
ncbi:peptidase M56 BlaR1 [Rhodopirellula maiorica SM1]|uniref:Peptidase M56 BlaR1 n=1 Tax=Rhodopirellula maiorica SM1 TaxID=1265738 RepID=M5RRC6_9BACT|nr:M56 family metallopeptidase [Rhodopirellula maiorica]EMI21830.1 peptidase M56 BlaR1 [Rhodopirellula maiorica SM1]